MSNERTVRFFNFDLPLLLAVIGLCTVSVLFIFSSGVNSTGSQTTDEYLKQLIWSVVAILIALSFSYINYNFLKDISLWLFIFFLFLLILTLFFGKVVNGAKAWLGFFGLGGQPSEFTKIVTILLVSKYIHEHRSSIKTLKTFCIAFAIVAIPMALILRQPDTGTTMVFIPIFLMLIFMGGGRLRHILFVALTGFLTLIFTLIYFIEILIFKDHNGFGSFISNPIMTLILISSLVFVFLLSVFGWKKYKNSWFYWISYFSLIIAIALAFSFVLRLVIKDYQVMRFIVFLDPKIDPKGSGWNLIQSMTAIGSGGLWGKGFLQGTQSHYHFLPMQSTDFIFSIIGEEWGFLGTLIIFSLYALLIGRLIFMLMKIKDHYGVLVISGFSAIFATHLFVNVGMVAGIMPITGIPLYFVSYGGSSLVAACVAIGISMNIYSRRYMF